VTYLNYDAKYLNEVSGANASPVKAWRWQQCTELGWFKTANQFYPLTSDIINEEWWSDYCKRIFGDQIKPLDTSIAAFRYGQRDLVAKNVIFVSETLDPFQFWGHHAAPRQPDMMNVFFDCAQDCKFGIDVVVDYKDKKYDPSLQPVFDTILDKIANWVKVGEQK